MVGDVKTWLWGPWVTFLDLPFVTHRGLSVTADRRARFGLRSQRDLSALPNARNTGAGFI